MSKTLDTKPNLSELTLSWVQRYNEPALPSERVEIMDKLISNEPIEIVVSVHKQIHGQLVEDLKQIRQQSAA